MKRYRVFAIAMLIFQADLSAGIAAAGVRDATYTIQASTQARTGPPNGSLAVALFTKTATAHTGQSIVVMVELRNVGTKTVYFQPAYSDRLTFDVKSMASNASLPQRFDLVSVPQSARSTGTPIAPGTSQFHEVSLTDMFDLSKPGTYEVFVHVPVYYVATQDRKVLESNSISIKVLP